jgi:hypothetical protein
MFRIVDLPEGGGANRGSDLWFRVVDEEGQTATFCLAAGLTQSFVDGVWHFADQAAGLRGDAASGRIVVSKPVAQVTCLRRDDLLEIVLEDGTGRPQSFQLDSSMTKKLLAGVLSALSATPPKEAPREPY